MVHAISRTQANSYWSPWESHHGFQWALAWALNEVSSVFFERWTHGNPPFCYFLLCSHAILNLLRVHSEGHNAPASHEQPGGFVKRKWLYFISCRMFSTPHSPAIMTGNHRLGHKWHLMPHACHQQRLYVTWKYSPHQLVSCPQGPGLSS